jgi:hypothetical protein
MDAIHKAYDKIKTAYKTGNAETDSLGKELHARAEMNQAAMAGSRSSDSEPASPARTTPLDRVNRKPYGSGPGEEVIDTHKMTKALGSYKNGTDYVPKTGVYKLHEGEKVVPKEENEHADNPIKEAMENHSPEEKAHFSRAMHKLHGGALHKHLGIPGDQPIPMAKKQEAANSSNKHVAAMGRLAVAMSGWKHGKN